MDSEFGFEITPTITKEYLLKLNSEETYMYTLLGVSYQKGLFKSTLRIDHHKTCSICRKNGVLIYTDFGEPSHKGDFVKVAMIKYDLNYNDALYQIAVDFNIVKAPNHRKIQNIIKVDKIIEETEEIEIKCKIKSFTDKELKWWNEYGISKKTLEKFNVYSVEFVFLNGELMLTSSINSPIFGYYNGKKEGKEQWKIYRPSIRKGMRFLTSGNWIQGLKYIPKSGNYLIITKSMKDVLCFYELGYSAIAPQGESTFIDSKLYNKLKDKFEKIYCLYDNDRAGLKAMIKFRKEYSDIEFIYIGNKQYKDISDYVKGNGIEKTKKEIIAFLIEEHQKEKFKELERINNFYNQLEWKY